MANKSNAAEALDSCITPSIDNSSLMDCCFCPAVQGYVLVTVTIILTVVGSLANSLVCVSIFGSPRLRKTQNYFIANLAVGDLVLTAMAMPLYAVYTVGEMERSCVTIISRIKGFNMNISVLVSILTLCAISIERLVVIVWPLKYKTIITEQRIGVAIATFWIILGAYGIIIATDLHTHSGFVYTVFTFVSLAGMGLCYVIIVLSYMIILFKSIKMMYNRRILAPNQPRNTDRRVALTVALVISLFTITWGPFVFFRFFVGSNHSGIWLRVSELLALSSSAFDSLIYFYRNREYRVALSQLVLGASRVHTAASGKIHRRTVNLELSNRPV